VLTIRKFSKIPLTVENLISFGSLTPESAEFLKACVQSRLNIVVSGGTGSGKTTLLNVLSSFIPGDERIVTIENAAELQLRQEHVITIETRPPNIEGKGEITIRDMVINALRMRPERIIVGECRGAEALDMLQAMNTGHDGSMTTLHSNSPRDTLSRLETMVLMAGFDLPHRAIREQIASAIQLIVHQERMRDGTRKITNVTEVQGMEGEIITMSDIFVYERQGVENGKVIGRLIPTGLRPKFIEQIEIAGIRLPPSIFGIGSRR
jgi:pilus assembly protein CpaF